LHLFATIFVREEIVKIQNVEVRSAVKSLFAEQSGIPTDRLADPRTVARVLQRSPFCVASVRLQVEKLFHEWRGLLFDGQSGSSDHEDRHGAREEAGVVADVEDLPERNARFRLWTADEVAALKDGIETYGFGQWERIKEEFSPLLMHRTPHQILCKARELQCKGSLRGKTIGRGGREQFRNESCRLVHGGAGPKVRGSSTQCRGAVIREWTVEETAALKRGIEMFGPGKWREIQERFSPELDGRSFKSVYGKGWKMIRSNAAGAQGSVSAREQIAYERPTSRQPLDDHREEVPRWGCWPAWTEDEIAAVVEGIETIGYGQWREIKEAFSERLKNRSEKAIQHRGYEIGVSKRSPNPLADKVESSQSLSRARFCHPWTLDEETALREGLQEFGPGNWHRIREKFSDRLKSRSVASLASRYYSVQFQRNTNGLQESSSQLQRWTLDEERALERAVRQVGYGDWQGILDHFSTNHKGRTLGQIRSKANHMRNRNRFGEIVSSVKPLAAATSPAKPWTRSRRL
jgi:Myb-like DNA-binding domain